MAKSRHAAELNFPKNYLILSYLEVLFPLVTYKITFDSFRYLYAHKTQTSLQ